MHSNNSMITYLRIFFSVFLCFSFECFDNIALSLLDKVTHILQKYCKSSNFIPLQRQEMTFSYLLHQINAEICTEK